MDEALQRFTEEDPNKAALVKLRYFAGLRLSEAAEVLGFRSQLPSDIGLTHVPGFTAS